MSVWIWRRSQPSKIGPLQPTGNNCSNFCGLLIFIENSLRVSVPLSLAWMHSPLPRFMSFGPNRQKKHSKSLKRDSPLLPFWPYLTQVPVRGGARCVRRGNRSSNRWPFTAICLLVKEVSLSGTELLCGKSRTPDSKDSSGGVEALDLRGQSIHFWSGLTIKI